jgi:hypothetical protein
MWWFLKPGMQKVTKKDAEKIPFPEERARVLDAVKKQEEADHANN